MLWKERGAEGRLVAPRIIVTPSVSEDGMQFQPNALNAPRDGVLKQDNVAPEIFWENKRTRKGSKVVVEHNCS